MVELEQTAYTVTEGHGEVCAIITSPYIECAVDFKFNVEFMLTTRTPGNSNLMVWAKVVSVFCTKTLLLMKSTKVRNPRHSTVLSLQLLYIACESIHTRKDCAVKCIYMQAYNCTLADKNCRLHCGKHYYSNGTVLVKTQHLKQCSRRTEAVSIAVWPCCSLGSQISWNRQTDTQTHTQIQAKYHNPRCACMLRVNNC